MRDVRRSQSCVPEDCLGMIRNNVLKVDEDGISTDVLSAFSNSPSGTNKVSCDSVLNPPVDGST